MMICVGFVRILKDKKGTASVYNARYLETGMTRNWS